MATANLLKSELYGGKFLIAELTTGDTFNPIYLDPSIAGQGINFSTGVLSVNAPASGGLFVGTNGVSVHYDPTSLTISSNKLAVLNNSFKSYQVYVNSQNSIGGTLSAKVPGDILNLSFGYGIDAIADPISNTLTINTATQTYQNGLKYDSVNEVVEIDPNYAQFSSGAVPVAYWTSLQRIGGSGSSVGFQGSKIIIQTHPAEAIGTPIIEIINSGQVPSSHNYIRRSYQSFQYFRNNRIRSYTI